MNLESGARPVAESSRTGFTSTGTPVIALDGLGVRFGKRDILKDLRISLSGRTIGLLGPNGAGKSTLIQTLVGFVPPSSGTARVFGHDIRRDAARIRSLIGYMPENDSFIADMSAVSFTRMMGELSGLPRDAALERAHEALFYVGLGESRYRMLGTYSLGMKQLAKLAQAIVHGPKLVILDEPTNGLDPPARARMIRLIQEMRESGQMNLVICSHLLRDVEETCEEVLILKQGRIVHSSNLEEERRANKRFVELEAYGQYDGFAEALTTLGCECEAPGGIAAHGISNGTPPNGTAPNGTIPHGSIRIKMTVPAGLEVREIYRLAAQRNLQLRRLNYRRDTLEEIFLKAMES